MNRKQRRRTAKAAKHGRGHAPLSDELSREFDLAAGFYRARRFAEAEEVCRRVLAARPTHPGTLDLLGTVLFAAGCLDEAAKAYKQALTHAPGYANAHNNLGLIQKTKGNWEQALACFRRAIELNPNLADAHTNLGNVLYVKCEFEAAVAAHERAIALRPDFAVAYYNLGNAQKAISTTEAAIASFRKAVTLAPEYADAYCNLGVALQERGENEAAIACYENAVAFGHGFAIGYNLLLAAKKITPEDPIVEAIEHRIESPATSPADRTAMLLGLAYVYDAAGDYATAFATASRANDMARDAADFTLGKNKNSNERIIRLFPKEVFSKENDHGNDSTLPIFIVGMPRAGKTLVERLLTAHPLVCGAHENQSFTNTVLHLKEWLSSGLPYPECMDSLTPDEGRRLGSEYIESLRKHWPDARYLTITHPFNYLYVGLIQLVLPQARIIHCIRDPLDTCLRCYFKNFRTLPFSFDLSELGDYYLSYKRLMDHWQAVLPRPILEVEFERLVADPVTVGREIYAYCGLQPDATDGSSEHSEMVRVLAGLGATETGRWRHYAEYLEPLRSQLADAAS